MLRNLILATLLVGWLWNDVSAQVYRPPGLEYQEVTKGRFRMIFPKSEDSLAKATYGLLSQHYGAVSKLTGGKITRIPVVLNNFNDLSNGFVTPYWYRIEVEIPAIKGKTLNPRLGGWLENVMPHELVHAAHLNVMPPLGLNWFVGLIWPDQGRSLHFNAHLGFHEGLAVYYESGIDSASGRGNYPFFTNRLHANQSGDRSWGTGSMLNPASHNRPGGGRHYIGGHAFMEWYHERYGEEATAKAIRFNARFPFLGLSPALWYASGATPWAMDQDFSSYLEHVQMERNTRIPVAERTEAHLFDAPFRGEEIRRPKFLPDGNLIVHASFYNQTSGFYLIRGENLNWELVYETNQVEDFRYDLHADGQKLLFSNYRPHAIYNTTSLMDVYELYLDKKTVRRLSDHQRVFSPVYAGNSILALQTDHESAQLVELRGTSSSSRLFRIKPDNLIEVQHHPAHASQLAVIANRNGTQGIWFVQLEAMGELTQRAPDIGFKEASIFDLEWSRDGERLMFSADRNGVINLYEYDVRLDRVTQITNDLYNAFEGSYNADASVIAYVVQRGDFRKLATLSRTEFYQKEIEPAHWKNVAHPRVQRHGTAAPTDMPSYRDYHPLLHLFPRGMALDYTESSTLGRSASFSLIGGDMLQRHMYTARFTSHSFITNYADIDVNYLYTGFWPGLSLDYTQQALATSDASIFRKVNTFAVGAPFRIRTEGNVRFSSVSITPRIQFQEYSLMTSMGQGLMNSVQKRTSFRLSMAYNHRLRQFMRDAQPNSGSAILISTTRDLTNEVSSRMISAMSASYYQYLPLMNQWNHSLLLRTDVLTQNFPFYSIDNVLPQGFADVNNLAESSFRNAAGFRTRYTIPLAAPDNGGFTFPFYAQQVYMVLFSNTFVPLGEEERNLYQVSRTMIGTGLRFVTGFSNFRVDIGVGIAYEFTRKNYFVSFGEF